MKTNDFIQKIKTFTKEDQTGPTYGNAPDVTTVKTQNMRMQKWNKNSIAQSAVSNVRAHVMRNVYSPATAASNTEYVTEFGYDHMRTHSGIEHYCYVSCNGCWYVGIGHNKQKAHQAAYMAICKDLGIIK